MKSFKNTASAETIEFEIEDDVYEAIAPRQVGAGVLEKYFAAIAKGDIFNAHNEFFAAVLTEESHKVFIERILDKENPITLDMLNEVSTWLLGDIYMGGGQGNSTTEPVAPSGRGRGAKKSTQSSTPGAA